MSIALKILSWVYGSVSSVRNTLYDLKLLPAYQSKLPVISVGNLTAGGTGKTPLCILIAQELKNRGKSPVILSRGYKGKIHGPHVVSSSDTAKSVGDEPFLLARTLGSPVVVSRRRARGAKFIEKNNLGDVIILDDGFQHRALKRSIDILTVDVSNEHAIESFLEGDLLPLGRFREKRDKALNRANIVVFSERRPNPTSPLDSRLLAVVPSSVTIFRSYVEPIGIFSVSDPVVPVYLTQVVAISGIASASGFHDTLRATGTSVAATEEFRDHFVFTATSVAQLNSLYPGLPLVCTEKDSVKIRALPEELQKNIYVLKIALRVSPADAFMVHLIRLIPHS